MRTKQRALSLVVALLSLATLIGVTSAIRNDELSGVAAGGIGDGGELGFGGDGAVGPDGIGEPGAPGVDGSGPGAVGPGARTGGTSTNGPGGTQRGGPQGPGGATSETGPIRVAYTYVNLAGLGASVGGVDPTTDSTKMDREFKALFDDLNAKGGIGGRRIEYRGFEFSFAEFMSEDSQVRRCSQIAQDFKAHYVLDTYVYGPGGQECFARNRVPIITLSSTLAEETLLKARPYVTTTFPTIDSQFRALAPKLKEVGYLAGAKVGVFLDQTPRVDGPYRNILEPSLRAAGTPVAAVARAGINDQDGIRNAESTFASAGVTHVIFIGNYLQFASFTQQAQTQESTYRYAVNDYYTLAATATTGQTMHDTQLKGMVAVSVCNDPDGCIVEDNTRNPANRSPYTDRNRLAPGLRRCLDTMTRLRGADYYNPNNQSTGTKTACEHFFLWTDAIAAGGGADLARFAAGVRSLRAWQAPRVFGTDFADGRHTGASHYAVGKFDTLCRCMVRATPWTRPA
ncbi:MAG TPA: ABC transporter substrate-binding protein [Acidimicrobiales bacterium]|nr:ABC transporter substrate-binding protein [Acidimicrobiales bacterium]